MELKNSAKAINDRDKLLMDIRRLCSKIGREEGRQKLHEIKLPDFQGWRAKEEKFVLEYLKYVLRQIKNSGKSCVHIYGGDKVSVYGYKLDSSNIDLGPYRDMHVNFPEMKIEIV